MRRYETLMVLHPELPDAQTRETIDRTRRLIEEMGGRVDQMHEWGMRELAYPIRKLSRGYYVLAEYEATAEIVNELERNLKIADEYLRFISVAAPAVGRAPSTANEQPRTDESGGSQRNVESGESADEASAAK